MAVISSAGFVDGILRMVLGTSRPTAKALCIMMRHFVLTALTVVTLTTGVFCLALSGYAALSLVGLFVHSGGRVVAPDTGFLLVYLLNFGLGSLILLPIGIRRPASKNLAGRVLFTWQRSSRSGP